MSLNNNTLPKHVTLSFPSKILSGDYNKKLTYITIYESKTFRDISELLQNAANRVKEDAKKAADAVLSGNLNRLLEIEKEIREFRGEEKLTIVLPIPNQLSDSQEHSFSTDTGFVKDIVDNTSIGGKIDKIIGKTAANMNAQKIIANPGFFQNYTGSQPRQFNFTFYLIPNNKSEAETLRKIILTLKKYSSPTLRNNAFLVAPHFFRFQFSNDTLQELTGIRPCVITNISVDYSQSGFLETTFDGMPKSMLLNINVTELRTLTSQQW